MSTSLAPSKVFKFLKKLKNMKTLFFSNKFNKYLYEDGGKV